MVKNKQHSKEIKPIEFHRISVAPQFHSIGVVVLQSHVPLPSFVSRVACFSLAKTWMPSISQKWILLLLLCDLFFVVAWCLLSVSFSLGSNKSLTHHNTHQAQAFKNSAS